MKTPSHQIFVNGIPTSIRVTRTEAMGEGKTEIQLPTILNIVRKCMLVTSTANVAKKATFGALRGICINFGRSKTCVANRDES